jgi:COMPASS component SWD3
VLKGHGLNISDLAWGHDSTLLLSGAYDKTCKLWDVESGKQLDSFEGEGFVQCVRFHPQGTSAVEEMIFSSFASNGECHKC